MLDHWKIHHYDYRLRQPFLLWRLFNLNCYSYASRFYSATERHRIYRHVGVQCFWNSNVQVLMFIMLARAFCRTGGTMLPALKIDILLENGCGCQRKICNVGKHCLRLLLFICGVEFWELTFLWREKRFSFFLLMVSLWCVMGIPCILQTVVLLNIN